MFCHCGSRFQHFAILCLKLTNSRYVYVIRFFWRLFAIITGQLPLLNENKVILYAVVADFVASISIAFEQVILNEAALLHPANDGVDCR